MENRSNSIKRVSLISIGVNVLLVMFKAIVGLISGSLAIIMDAVNNLADAMGSGITILGVVLSSRKPDAKHPFGYGRIEYLAAVVISILVLFTGISSAVESVKGIITPSSATYNVVTIVIVSGAILTKVLLGFYVKKKGKLYASDSLVASGTDALGDAALSASTLVAIVVSLIWGVAIEAYIALVISAVIIKAGVDLLMESLGNILGKRTQGELAAEIKAEISKVEGVLGVYDLVLHDYGPDRAMGSVHVEVDDSSNASQIYKIVRHVQQAVLKRFHIILTVGIYASNTTDKDVLDIKEYVGRCALQQDGVVGFHGFFMEGDTMVFDIVADFGCDIHAATTAIKSSIADRLPAAQVIINIDKNYTD